MRPEDRYYTEADRILQQLAATDWAAFSKLVGDDNMTAAKICILRAQGASYGQLKIKFSKTKDQIKYASDKCDCVILPINANVKKVIEV